MQAGLSYAEACDTLPAVEVCNLVTCYWESLGIETEPMSRNNHEIKQLVQDKLTSIINREKQWQLEQL
jgi:hypothetical protein